MKNVNKIWNSESYNLPMTKGLWLSTSSCLWPVLSRVWPGGSLIYDTISYISTIPRWGVWNWNGKTMVFVSKITSLWFWVTWIHFEGNQFPGGPQLPLLLLTERTWPGDDRAGLQWGEQCSLNMVMMAMVMLVMVMNTISAVPYSGQCNIKTERQWELVPGGGRDP